MRHNWLVLWFWPKRVVYTMLCVTILWTSYAPNPVVKATGLHCCSGNIPSKMKFPGELAFPVQSSHKLFRPWDILIQQTMASFSAWKLHETKTVSSRVPRAACDPGTRLPACATRVAAATAVRAGGCDALLLLWEPRGSCTS